MITNINVSESASRYRKSVIESSSQDDCNRHAGSSVYYVSESGDDSNNGFTASKAVKTLDCANSLLLRPGDTVLFERGGIWRGQLSAKAGVTYSAYGAGMKPRLYGSRYNYSEKSF